MNEQKNPERKPRGIILKEAREARALPLEAVHESTKIPLDVLKAIEEGYTVRTLSPFYLKAFKKKYAQFLGVNLDVILEDHHREVLPQPVETVEQEEKRRFGNKLSKYITRDFQQKGVKVVLILVALFMAGRIVGCVHTRMTSSPKEKKVKVEKVKAAQIRDTAAVKSSENKPSDAKSQVKVDRNQIVRTVATQKNPVKTQAAQPLLQPVEADSKTGVTLVVKARKSSWIQVKVDGNLVFQSTLRNDVSESWEADKMIELSGNNIQHLEFDVNGKSLGTLKGGDRNARRVVVTKDGFMVKK